MRRYECVVILDSDLPDDDVQNFTQRYTNLIKESGGDIVKVEDWGIKRLAYLVKKKDKGRYMLLDYVGTPALIYEMERQMKISEEVMKFLSLKLEDNVDLEAFRAKAAEEAAAAAEAAARAAKEAEEAAAEAAARAAKEAEEAAAAEAQAKEAQESAAAAEESQTATEAPEAPAADPAAADSAESAPGEAASEASDQQPDAGSPDTPEPETPEADKAAEEQEPSKETQ
jgi:small subunit ribosomal protein S6